MCNLMIQCVIIERINIVSTLLSVEEDKEEEKYVNIHSLSQKMFDMKALSTGNKSGDPNIFENRGTIVNYKDTINYIRLNPKFMMKEELLRIKVFPTREWIVFHTKVNKPDENLLHENNRDFRGWKKILLIIAIGVSCFVIGFLIIMYGES